MMIPEWLDHPYWHLEQVVYWNRPPGRQLPIDQLLGGLQEGRIGATGRQVIYEDSRPPKLGQRVHIPALAWVDLKIGPCDFGYGDEYLEVFETDGDNWRPAWQDVRIKRDDAFALWGSPDGSSTKQPAVRSGLPGKPTSKHLYLQKLEARIETGEVAGSLEQEATFLKDYLESTYPVAPASGLSAIKNNIRELYKSRRQA